MRQLLPIVLLPISVFAADVAGTKPPASTSSQPLNSVQRVYVDQLTGGDPASQMRDLLISALQRSGRFLVTENPERADHFLRGAADDSVFQDQFDSSESLNARAFSSRGSSRSKSSLGAMEVGMGQNESTHIRERKHEAMAAVRLVTREGDVIWSTTQESQGAKFRSASADVADKVVKQLITDLDRKEPPILANK